MRFGVALPPPPPAEDSSCSMANRTAVFLLTLMWNHTVNHKVTNTVSALAWLGLRLFAWLLSTLARTWSLLVTLGSIRVLSTFCPPVALALSANANQIRGRSDGNSDKVTK